MDDIGEEELSNVQNEASNSCLPDPKELGSHGMRSPTSLLTDIGYFTHCTNVTLFVFSPMTLLL